MVDVQQRRLLGQFLRSHREQLAPTAPTGRRRTPGLRREELAERAGISTIWCAWIEQGREVQASPKALSRLAGALGLSPAERATLFELAGRNDPEAGPPAAARPTPNALKTIVSSNMHPAYALDRLWNACCWNEPAASLFPDWLGPGSEHNLLRYVFLDRSARSLTPKWHDWAQQVLDEFRADLPGNQGDPQVHALIEALRAESPLFSKSWAAPSGRDSAIRTFAPAGAEAIAYAQTSFNPSEYPDYRLVILTPVSSN